MKTATIEQSNNIVKSVSDMEILNIKTQTDDNNTIISYQVGPKVPLGILRNRVSLSFKQQGYDNRVTAHRPKRDFTNNFQSPIYIMVYTKG